LCTGAARNAVAVEDDGIAGMQIEGLRISRDGEGASAGRYETKREDLS